MQMQTILLSAFSILSFLFMIIGRSGLRDALRRRPSAHLFWYLPAFSVLGVLLSKLFGGAATVSLTLFACVRILIFTPLFEEFVFRGGLLLCPRDLLRGKPHARLFAVLLLLLSAAAFAVVHAGAGQMLYAFCMGLCLGAAALREKSLWCSIAMHAVWNALCILLRLI